MRPRSMSQICAHVLPHAIRTAGTVSFICLGHGYTYSKGIYPSPVPFYVTSYLWQSDLIVTRSAPSSENFLYTLRHLQRRDCARKVLVGEGDRQKERDDRDEAVFEWLALPLQWLVIWDLVSNPFSSARSSWHSDCFLLLLLTISNSSLYE